MVSLSAPPTISCSFLMSCAEKLRREYHINIRPKDKKKANFRPDLIHFRLINVLVNSVKVAKSDKFCIFASNSLLHQL